MSMSTCHQWVVPLEVHRPGLVTSFLHFWETALLELGRDPPGPSLWSLLSVPAPPFLQDSSEVTPCHRFTAKGTEPGKACLHFHEALSVTCMFCRFSHV